MHFLLEEGLSTGVFIVTRRIAIGRFVTKQRGELLLARGFTHVLNVSEAESLPETFAAGFREVVDIPIVDLLRIPDETARRCLDVLHAVMSEPTTNVYLHCIAGQNRSPTILWLYLIALGLPVDAARTLICERAPDAVPGHASLIDDALLEFVRQHGKTELSNVIDADILLPAY